MTTSSTGLRKVVVVDGTRTPFLKAGTDFKDLISYDLARLAIDGLLTKSQVDPGQIDWVIMGNVISNTATSNVAREAALAAGISEKVPAYTVTLACISANKAITNAVDLIRTGQANAVIAGGTESMSDVPIRFRKAFRDKLVESQKYRKITDYLKFLKGLSPSDLLPEVPAIAEYSTGRSMGEDCDRMAARFGVTREEQDQFAARSHQLAARASESGLLEKEISSVAVPPSFKMVEVDNGFRGDSTVEKLAGLRPAFIKPHGTLTAGNSSFLTDGASAVLLMAEETALAMGYSPLATIVDYAYSAQNPEDELLLGPAYSTPKVLDKTGLTLKDIDVFEFHEAFAAQMVANLKCLNSNTFAKENLGRAEKVGEVPMDKLNTRGGSLSLGHPFGATGGRLVVTTVNRLIDENARYGLVASCAAGAHGNAIILERYQ